MDKFEIVFLLEILHTAKGCSVEPSGGSALAQSGETVDTNDVEGSLKIGTVSQILWKFSPSYSNNL